MHVPVEYAEFRAGIKRGKKTQYKNNKKDERRNHKYNQYGLLVQLNLTYTGGRDCPEEGLLEMAEVNKKRIKSDRILP